MEHTKTFKLPLYPTKEQVAYMKCCIDASCNIYNDALDWIFTDHLAFRKGVETGDFSAWLGERNNLIPLDKDISELSGEKAEKAAQKAAKRATARAKNLEKTTTGKWWPPSENDLAMIATRLQQRARAAHLADTTKAYRYGSLHAERLNAICREDLLRALVKDKSPCIYSTDEIERRDGRWEVRRTKSDGEYFTIKDKKTGELREWHSPRDIKDFPAFKPRMNAASFIIASDVCPISWEEHIGRAPEKWSRKTKGYLRLSKDHLVEVGVYREIIPYLKSFNDLDRKPYGISKMNRIVQDASGRWYLSLSVKQTHDDVSYAINPETTVAVDIRKTATHVRYANRPTEDIKADHKFVKSVGAQLPELRETDLVARYERLVLRYVSLQRALARKDKIRKALKERALSTGVCPHCKNADEKSMAFGVAFFSRKEYPIFRCTHCGFDTSEKSKNRKRTRCELSALALRIANVKRTCQRLWVSNIANNPNVETVVLQERDFRVLPATTEKRQGPVARTAQINKAMADFAGFTLLGMLKVKLAEKQKNVILLDQDFEPRTICSCGGKIDNQTHRCGGCGSEMNAPDSMLSAFFANKHISGAISGTTALATFGKAVVRSEKNKEEKALKKAQRKANAGAPATECPQ